MEMNCLERQVKDRIAKSFGGRPMIIGRVANLTQPHNGRGGCQYRNRCIRGCPYGAYFSSNAATLPAAYATGKLTLRPFSIVTELIYDAKTRRATGVRIVDAETNQTTEYFARVIFLCASAIASTFILLNSISDRFPNGLGNDSGELGHNLMDHHFKVGANGLSDDFGDRFYRDSARTASTSRGSATSTRRPGRRTTFAASAIRAARAARTGRAASRS